MTLQRSREVQEPCWNCRGQFVVVLAIGCVILTHPTDKHLKCKTKVLLVTVVQD